MPLSFETQMLRIGELFCDAAVFTMPPFQRPYCWDEATAAQLYDDISSAMLRGQPDRPGRKNRQEYFLGPVIVTRGSTPHVLEVIDGQQRLVTLSILLAVIRDRLPLDSVLSDELQRLIVRPEHRLRRLILCPRVKLRDGDQQRFAEWVQTPGATRDIPYDPEDSDATSRILDAIERIASDLDDVKTEYLTQLASFILNNCYVIQVTARDLDDGYVLFRSLNSRGQTLDELDLARAELLGAQQPQADVDALMCDWNEAEVNLGRDEFSEYLHSVLSLVATRPQGRDMRDLLREVLGDQMQSHNFRILLAAVLRHAAKLDEGEIDFGVDTGKIQRIVECLRQSPIPEWRSAALPWLALAPAGFSTLQFLTALDSLCLGLWVLGKNKSQTLRRIKSVAAEVIQHREAVVNHAGALRFTQAEQTQLKKILANPIGWKKRFLKPLLLRLNAHMLDSQIPIYFPHGVTIEHVLPRTPAANGPWPPKFPSSGRRKICTELLGNYALLTHPINARAKNLDFPAKRKIMFSTTSHQAFPLTTELANYEEWNEQELLRRHEKLVGLAFEVLGLAPAVGWQLAAE